LDLPYGLERDDAVRQTVSQHHSILRSSRRRAVKQYNQNRHENTYGTCFENSAGISFWKENRTETRIETGMSSINSSRAAFTSTNENVFLIAKRTKPLQRNLQRTRATQLRLPTHIVLCGASIATLI